jgi:Protein of unknown function (DUF3667)
MTQHLRTDKTCLNCGASVDGQFCPNCGQKNVPVRESFGHLIGHFFQDLTHYDSKFFLTIRNLLVRPGFLTREYLAGKRASYLHPVRLYIFVSFLYFLLLLSFQHSGRRVEEQMAGMVSQSTRQQITDSMRSWLNAHRYMDSKGVIKDSIAGSLFSIARASPNSNKLPLDYVIVGGFTYKHLLVFDSAQKALPPDKREKGLKPWLYKRWMATINRYGNGITPLLEEKTQHFVPKMMFLLLPLFALLLKLLYRINKYYYVDHAIFSLHFHSAVFIIFLVFTIMGLVISSLSNYFGLIQLFVALVYLVVAIHKFYRQSLLISILKAATLAIIYSIFILLGYAFIAMSALTFA